MVRNVRYTAFYRKLRPDTFSGVVGQNHITKTLINQMASGRFAHAYLFCGTRGTGKTSTAKIFAKSINCEAPQNGEPCGVCRPCKEIEDKTSVNIYEIDAASNSRVEDVRDMLEDVKFPPMSGRFKVFIVDEVHMMSTNAFNALLKTLEEPPEHVVFILATTDPQKVPPTIHSRCQRFDFRRIGERDMVAALKGYMESEGVNIDDEALGYVAKLSDGAMRDALSLLERCSAFYFGEEITLAKVKALTGSVDSAVFAALLEALKAKDTARCINIIDEIIRDGRDVLQFVSEFVGYLREELAADFKSGEIIKYITEFSRLVGKIRTSGNDRILLEVACVLLCNPEVAAQAVTPAVIQTIQQSSAKPAVAAPNPLEKPKVKKAVPEDFKQVLARWQEFCAQFSDNRLRGFLLKTRAGYMNGDCLYIVCDTPTDMSVLRKGAEGIAEGLQKKFGIAFEINVIQKDIYGNMHKNRFGAADDFDYGGLINELKGAINFDITTE